MPAWSATFGPDGSYFFNSPHKWSHSGMPMNLTDLIGEKDLRDIHELTLGPNGSYVCTYSNNDGMMYIRRHNLPAKLEKWLVPVEGGSFSAERDMGSLRVTLGPDGSFAAWDNTGAAQWENLPATLSTYIRSIMDENNRWKPGYELKNLSLGANGSWVFISKRGAGCHNLQGGAPELAEFLLGLENYAGLEGVQLCPFVANRWGVVYTNGNNWHCTPPESVMRTHWEAFGADWMKAVNAENAAIPPQQQKQVVYTQQKESKLKAVLKPIAGAIIEQTVGVVVQAAFC
ncbi:hypothetical protein H072_8698 [Dactylellina haptotyla CBS 200.50]|uniref:Uncharacterized protein n=1 Tax=Dactylellina haptotyla (strain CBS 200.50) TaxID=1284197 RepID=S8A3K3_DACHA|nr:hypothetical protein H072_8698 [Dactylellina haptotyla CBS 200.50]